MKKIIFALDHYNVTSAWLQDCPNGLHFDVFANEVQLGIQKINAAYIDWVKGGFNTHAENEEIQFVSCNDVPQGQRYFFPIRVQHAFFFIKTPYLSRPLNIPERVLRDARKNICKILIVQDVEGQSNEAIKRHLFFIRQAELLKLSLQSLLFVDCNKLNKSVLKKYNINSYYFNTFEYWNASLPGSKIDSLINDITNLNSRPKKFISFNRRPHSHRLILVNNFLKAGLDNNSIITMGSTEEGWPANWLNIIETNYKTDLSYLKDKLPITFDIKDLVFNNPVDINYEAQLSAYFNVVTETFCLPQTPLPPHMTEPDHMFFSEKTFKPIICMQPFIQVNYAGSLKYLRELGYKTFHPYIDESYDEEKDNLKRIDKITNEVKRLCSFSDKELKKLLKTLLPVLVHNKDVYKNNLKFKHGSKTFEEIFNDWDKEHYSLPTNYKHTEKTGPFNIAMIGLGKLGKDCAEVMATKHNVTGYDVRSGITSSSIKVVNTIEEAVQGKDIIFIAVPTPHDPQYGGELPISHLPPKDFDYNIVKECLQKIHACTTTNQLIVLISTVLPGTVRKQLIQHLPQRRFVYNPYLIAMGTVKEDMVNPEMVIIGTEDGNSNNDCDELIHFYKTFINPDTRIVQGTWDEAESIKIFYNTFISAKLSLVNMIQDVAEKNGNINVDVVTSALRDSTYRIMGPAYMIAGMGDGGACHPRDNIALRYMAQNLDLGYDLFGSIMQSREIQAKNLAVKCLQYGKEVCIVGAAYKPKVPYTQGSYSYLVGHYINQLGGWLSYYDPNTGDNNFEAKANVYLIGYWEKWVEDIAWPNNCTIIDPWRKFKTNNQTIKVIHYGNTR